MNKIKLSLNFFHELMQYVENNYHEGYDLIFVDLFTNEKLTVKNIRPYQIPLIALYVSSTEHDFPENIYINNDNKSYCIDIYFMRGKLPLNSTYVFFDGEFWKELNN